MKSEINKKSPAENDNIVIGRNAVMELLKSGRPVENIYICQGEKEGSITKIMLWRGIRELLLKK